MSREFLTRSSSKGPPIFLHKVSIGRIGIWNNEQSGWGILGYKYIDCIAQSEICVIFSSIPFGLGLIVVFSRALVLIFTSNIY